MSLRALSLFVPLPSSSLFPPCPLPRTSIFVVGHDSMARSRSSCPPGVLCLSAGLSTVLFTLIGVAFVFLVLHFLRSSLSLLSPSPSPSVLSLPMASVSSLPAPPVHVSVQGGDSRYDRAPQPLRDWMAPPEFPPRGGLSRLPFNQPTQGLPESFQSVGMVRVEDKMLPLYGRRTAGSNDRWNYYTRTDTYNPIPLPVRFQKRDCMDDVGCPEISSGDNIHVNGLHKEGKTEIYRFDGPKYIPGLF